MSNLVTWLSFLLWLWRHRHDAHGFTVAFGKERDIPKTKKEK